MTTTSATPHDHHHQQQQPQREQEKAPVSKPQMKKQARRRTHTSRPYQERLLNMAEARREIVTALKIHRANMRQQPARHHQPEQPPLLHPLQQQRQAQMVSPFQDQSSSQAVVVEEALAAPPPTSHAASSSFADQLCNSPLAHLVYSSPVLPYPLAPPLDLPAAIGDGLDLECHSLEAERLASSTSLPAAQPLGLNLSFQGFSGYVVDDAKQLDDCGDLYGGVPLIQSSSPAASSWGAAYSAVEMELASTHGSPTAVTNTAVENNKHPSVDAPAALVSPVLDDGETQAIGERPQGVEWSGTMTAAGVTAAASAWWSKTILEGMESGAAVGGSTAEDLVAAASDLPAEWRWPCDDAGAGAVAGPEPEPEPEPPQDVLETMLVDGDYSGCCYDGANSGDGGGDTLLPCVDDIEGWWDGEWFSTSPDDDRSLDTTAHGCAVDHQPGDV